MSIVDDSLFFIIFGVFFVGLIAFVKVAIIDEKKNKK